MKHLKKIIGFIAFLCLVILNQNCSGGMTSTVPASTSNASSGAPSTTLPGGGGGPVAPPVTGAGMFASGNVWYQDISSAAKDASSDTIINWLAGQGLWAGGGGSLQVDNSFNIQYVISTTPFLSFSKSSGYYSGECDNLNTFPVPAGGSIEGNSGYSCNDGGDCHLLVVDPIHQKLWESYQTSVSGNLVNSTCGIQWDLTKVYPANLRGDNCTSTDAAGYPVAPLLFTADELKAGAINHAIRFILPNNMMASGVYVHPATHVGGPSGPAASAIPYGARLRLKSTFNVSGLKPAAQVVAKALQRYGMMLADGGNLAFTAADDKYTTAKYSQVGFNFSDLKSLKITDFEMVGGGTRYKASGDCKLNP